MDGRVSVRTLFGYSPSHTNWEGCPVQCPKCHYEPTLAEMQRSPADCTNCGVNYDGHARYVEQVVAKRAADSKENSSKPKVSPAVNEAVWKYPGAQPVVVVDINMNFWSMVFFMVKWVIASIPAAIILALIIMIVGGASYTLVTAVSGYYGYKEKFEKSKASSVLSGDTTIYVPGSVGATYFDLGRSQSDRFAVMTVRSTNGSGQHSYSRISVDCKSAFAVVTAQAPTLDYLNGYALPTDYQEIVENTPRHHIAKHACAGMKGIHRILL